MSNFWKIVIFLVVAYFARTWLFGDFSSSNFSSIYTPSNYNGSSYGGGDYEDSNSQKNLSGTYAVEACSNNSGNCYDLDADMSNGMVERIYFPNGGHLDIDGAELDEDGYAVGQSYTESEGYNGDEWEINCYGCE